MDIILVAAIGANGEMGLNNQLLWQLPGDLPRFKEMTMGSPIIMGRKTFDSIGRPLPGRVNIVLTANPTWQHSGTETVHTVDQALDIAKTQDTGKVFVIGGGEIYRLFLTHATLLELTEVQDTPVADTYFPNFSRDEFTEMTRQPVRGHTPYFDYVQYKKN